MDYKKLSRITDSDSVNYFKLARKSDITKEECEEVLKNGDWVARRELALNCPLPEILEALSKDSDSEVRRKLVYNKNLPEGVWNILASDEDTMVRGLVAFCCPLPEILEALSKDSDSEVRGYVALNHNVPVSLLKVLANDEDSWVRECVASSQIAPVEMLETLAKDIDKDVRKAVAKNFHTPDNVVNELKSKMKKTKSKGKHLYYFYDGFYPELEENLSFDELVNCVKSNLNESSEIYKEIEKNPQAIWDIEWDLIGGDNEQISYGSMNDIDDFKLQIDWEDE